MNDEIKGMPLSGVIGFRYSKEKDAKWLKEFPEKDRKELEDFILAHAVNVTFYEKDAFTIEDAKSGKIVYLVNKKGKGWYDFRVE